MIIGRFRSKAHAADAKKTQRNIGQPGLKPLMAKRRRNDRSEKRCMTR